MFRLINITNKNRDLDALKGLREIWNLLDLRNISRLKNTDESLELAGKIFMVIQNNVNEDMDQMPEPQKGGDGQGQEDTDGSSEMCDSQSNPTGDGKPMEGKGKGKGKDSDGTDGSDGGSTDKKGSVSSGVPNKNGAGGQSSPLNDRLKKQLQNAIEKQKKFLDGDITKKKISKADKKKIDVLDKADIETEVTGKGLDQGYYRGQSQGVQTYVIKNMTKSLIDSNMIPHLGTWRVDSNDVAVKKGITLGTILGKKLKTRNEERVLQTPRMKSGKLNGTTLRQQRLQSLKQHR
jgi:ketosteroid isomerase-like protein